MGGLVLAPNLLQAFMCWELVGLCSYLLIGYYWTKPEAGHAAVKAFWITKFADMGLLAGLILLYATTGSFEWTARMPNSVAAMVSALIFIGVMGKSAQVPLHVWLPNAMEGPTPVSALLHAATMVAAGVFLVVRAFPIFEAAPDVLTAMTWIGAVTAFLAACTAVVQDDIKKVLAYSTCSQLGFMVAALGTGSILGGYFHLTTMRSSRRSCSWVQERPFTRSTATTSMTWEDSSRRRRSRRSCSSSVQLRSRAFLDWQASSRKTSSSRNSCTEATWDHWSCSWCPQH